MASPVFDFFEKISLCGGHLVEAAISSFFFYFSVGSSTDF